MDASLSISKKDESSFNKILNDLSYALREITTEELAIIFKDSALLSIKVTIKTKKDALKNAASAVKNISIRYRKDGIIQSAKNDAKRLGDFAVSLPDKAKDIYNNFLDLTREEQIEAVSVTILTTAIFFASAGGLNLEGGLPDLDIDISGIQHHRNFFSHSILIGLGVEFTGRFSLNVLEKIKNRMPNDRHPVWDRVYNIIDSHKDKAIAAMWLGIGAHMLKDSGLFGGGVTPYKDLPFSMPMEAHKGLFAANGVASGIMGMRK